MDEARTIMNADRMTRGPAADPNPPSRPAALRHRVLRPMDPEIARTSTAAQLRELERGLAASASNRLPIDVRIAAPFFWRRCFMTFPDIPQMTPKLGSDDSQTAFILEP